MANQTFVEKLESGNNRLEKYPVPVFIAAFSGAVHLKHHEG